MIGYACINMNLSESGITTNRSMIKKTFLQKGINYASELALKNVQDLEKIVKWNVEHNILFFRMSSDMFPWASEYNVEDMENIEEIKTILQRVGEYATAHNVRLTTHPGPFNVLCSPNPNVVQNTIRDLEMHGKLFDMMGLSLSPYNKINIHCNGTYGDKTASLNRWCENFELLSNSVKSRLTIENDDKASMYSVKDLMFIHNSVGIPIVFDYHHHQFCTGDLSTKDALEMAISTWGSGITPIVHYSSSRAKETGNIKEKPQAHADYILEKIDTYGKQVDIMLECKAKELALLKYLEEYSV